ncbi:hypothetical protein [Vibrio rumoiensis]|uniref:Type 4 fimbrial biogenesis protein PilX N-terminal domain-containing protein n=1 Tax=Vibrio rumoiensis 1S-45 TaxID=1188252 RepID=A0A1E5E5E4_9VIBR|nr:hypothetical protein [Vibrio rumoiensis]OEF28580.1 hypothetical protein A1QC_04740 [Vibrio rumoiensis 1S-45]
MAPLLFLSRKHKQQGAATLLVAALLLLAALVITLASYKSVFFQAKRAQNEIEARQNQWALEGGLECVYTKAHIDRDFLALTTNTSSYLQSECVDHFKTTNIEVTNLGGKKLLIEPQVVDETSIVKLGKVLDMSSSRSAGAIKATADLFIRGATEFSPPDPGNETISGWECSAIRYKSYLDFDGNLQNKGVGSTIPSPSSDFSSSLDCLSDYSTQNPAELKSDIQQDSSLEPFKELFGVEPMNWTQVRDNLALDFQVINNPGVDCDNQLLNVISPTNTRIWIEGSCELSDALGSVATATQATSGVLLFIHNGIFSIKGSGVFKGALFHYNSGFNITSTSWDGFDNKATSNTVAAYFNYAASLGGVAYVQDGSFSFTGGQILDMSGQIAFFNNGLKFSYNSDVLDSIFGMTPPKWLKGSWNDF